MNAVDNAIKKYYDLKGKYNKKYNTKKYKIIKNTDYSTREKKRLLENVSMNCIKCKNNNGTIFEKKYNILIAKCGNLQNPCDLSIKINTGEYNNIFIILEGLEKDLELIKTNILKTKLSLLYGLIEDDEALKTFNDMKAFYKKYTTPINILYKELDEKLKVDVSDTIKEKIHYKKFIKENTIKIDELINRFKDLMNEAHVNNSDKKTEILEEAMEIYINELKPLSVKHRELGYKINKIISKELFSVNKIPVFEHQLIQTNNDISTYEIDINPAEIIENNNDIKKPKKKQEKINKVAIEEKYDFSDEEFNNFD